MLQYQFPQCNQIEACTEIPHSLISIFSLNSFPNLHTHKHTKEYFNLQTRIISSPSLSPKIKFLIHLQKAPRFLGKFFF